MSFFKSTAWTKQKEPSPLVAQCGRCGLFKGCKSPYMRVDGTGKRRVLIVCEGPGFNEDVMGRPLVGEAGNELSRILWDLGVDMRADTWMTNAIICRASDAKGKNRKPTSDEISHCRPNLLKAIEQLKPDVIIPLGMPAIQSVMSYAWKDSTSEYSNDSVARWADWNIPSVKLNAWICPSYHPSYLCRVKNKNAAAELIVKEHLAWAFSHTSKPHETKPDYAKQVRLVYNPEEIIFYIEAAMNRKVPLAFDFENSPLKPDRNDSYIICASISDGIDSIAFPWSNAIKSAFRAFVQSDQPKIAANIQHEERWCWRHLGCGVRNWYWDTMLGAHWANCAHGICGLKFQAFVLFGVEYYAGFMDDLIEKKGADGTNTHNRLREAEQRDLLTYCGLDSLYEVMVARKQMETYK